METRLHLVLETVQTLIVHVYIHTRSMYSHMIECTLYISLTHSSRGLVVSCTFLPLQTRKTSSEEMEIEKSLMPNNQTFRTKCHVHVLKELI